MMKDEKEKVIKTGEFSSKGKSAGKAGGNPYETEKAEKNIATGEKSIKADEETSAKDGARDITGHEQDKVDPYVGTVSVPPVNRRKMYPTIVDMLAILGVIFLSILLGGLVVALTNDTGMAGFGFALGYSLQMLPAIIFIRYHRKVRGAKPGISKFTFSKFNPPLVLWGILLVFVTSIVLEPLLALFPAKQIENLNDTIMAQGGWSILTTIILAPILEETLFRGQILGSIKEKYGSFWGLLLSSLFFALMHINFPAQALNAFVMALIFGYIYLKTNSLLSVIVIHALNNGIAYTMAELFDNNSAAMSFRSMISNDAAYYIVYGISLGLFIVGIIGMVRTVRRQKQTVSSGETVPVVEKDTVIDDNNITE